MRTLLLLAAVTAPAWAQDAPPACPRPVIVPGFERWATATPATALTPGRAAALTLAPAERLEYVPPLARPAQPGTFGATVPLHVAAAGRYRIALGAGAWIDVIGAGRRLESIDHMRGPACSGIAKIVAFQLAPGDYLVQLSEGKGPALAAMVAAE